MIRKKKLTDADRLWWLMHSPTANIGKRGEEVMREWNRKHPRGGIVHRRNLRAAIDRVIGDNLEMMR